MWFVNLLIFLLILYPRGYAHELERLPARDREKIEFLFTFLVQRDTLGFLLFGESKCLTFTGIPITHKEYFLPYKIEDGYKFQKKLKEAWYTWKRHEARFKHPNYLICENYVRSENEIYLQLFIFDKKKLRNTLEKYQKDFVDVLGTSFTPESFIAKLERKKKVKPLIKHDEKLLGILLGFGRDASTAFKNFDQNLEYLGKRPPGCTITPISFRGYKSSPETAELLEKYQEEIIEIEKIVKSNPFLEATLEIFCAP